MRNTISVFGIEIPIWKIAQHSSTFIGSIIIIIAFLKLHQDLTIKISIDKLYWGAVTLFTFGISCIRFIGNPKALHIGNLIVSFIGSFLLAITIIPLLIKFRSVLKNW